MGIALRVPLFSAPGAAARRAVAQAQVRQSEHGLNAATDAARLEVESAWTAFEASDEVVTTQEKALELARESVVDRAGVVRERRDHVSRAQRRAGAPAADRVAADAGEVLADRRGGEGESRGGGLSDSRCQLPVTSSKGPSASRLRQRPFELATGQLGTDAGPTSQAARSALRSGPRTPVTCTRGSCRPGARARRSRRRCPAGRRLRTTRRSPGLS